MEIIEKYFGDLTNTQKEQLGRLKDVYEDWNEKINVISRKDMDSFYEKHVLHSLGIATIFDFKEGTRILDVGTGGGFPGIPLAIMFPEVKFHLIDSIGKKINVVKAVAEELALYNVTAEQIRAEKHKGQYDFIISRAVTRMKNFMPWTHGKLYQHSFNEKPNGIIYLKGGDLNEELSEINKRKIIHLYDLQDCFEEEFFETKKIVHIF
ncbi:MAG: 16S rRNA (guanine(527)-N(7))-methyltransferase RsmG [Hyphomicrobiales bacterium]